MPHPLTFSIFTNASDLPADWDGIAARNVFLSRNYLRVLDESAPENMECRYIGIWKNDRLVGVAVTQHLDFSDIQTFGARDNCVKNKIRTFFFKRFSSQVLFLGNNMLTGQNSMGVINDDPAIIAAIHHAVETVAEQLRPHLIIWKDYEPASLASFNPDLFATYYKFSTQPNMIFEVKPEWNQEGDYVNAFLKKYRDQFKRARKKLGQVEKRLLSQHDIVEHLQQMHRLYLAVARNAPFNTFFLREDHFLSMKNHLRERFIVHGYFHQGKLICFSTMIENGSDIDTYFLGYDESLQKEKMLYLNMLYDMIAFSINHGYRRVILARTAMEIKSSVGAIPLKMFGFIKHRNPLLNRLMPKLFRYFEPEMPWQQRHPFRDREQPPSTVGEGS